LAWLLCACRSYAPKALRIDTGRNMSTAAEASLTAAKGTSVILVLNQYNCIGYSRGKHPDTRTMVFGSDDDSLDSVRDRCLCIAV
jgi:hypothetical protein